jgi:uncharacterized membrane protein
MLSGTLLLGWGVFNLVEGIVDHQVLGIHHVNETVPPSEWLWWDLGFLTFALLLGGAGWYLMDRSPGGAAARRLPGGGE